MDMEEEEKQKKKFAHKNAPWRSLDEMQWNFANVAETFEGARTHCARTANGDDRRTACVCTLDYPAIRHCPDILSVI
jgi:hypothetical protein